jgi:glutaredoxin
MENMTENPTGTNAELEAAKSMYAEWKKSHEKTTKIKKVSREEALKKHFVPREEKETFRAIHTNLSEKYLKVAFFHEVLTNKAGGKKQKRKVYCPAHNDSKVQQLDDAGQPVFDELGKAVTIPVKCPLCEEAKRILATQDISILDKIKSKEPLNEKEKEIKEKNYQIYVQSKKIEAKKFYMVKGVDRGKEKDGPKFWRFKFHYKQQGVADKLIPALFDWTEANGVHFANVENGIDVVINVIENSIPGSNYTYKDVSTINTSPRGSSPLHYDDSIVKAWLADTTTWREVYKPLTFSFMDANTVLDRLAKGTLPYWEDSNSNDKKWVFPDPRDAALAVKTNTRKQNLDATPQDFEQASDVKTNMSAVYDAMQPKIANMVEAAVDTEDAVNITPQPQVQPQEEVDAVPEHKQEEYTVPEQPKTQPKIQPKATSTSISTVTNGSDIEDLDLPF